MTKAEALEIADMVANLRDVDVLTALGEQAEGPPWVFDDRDALLRLLVPRRVRGAKRQSLRDATKCWAVCFCPDGLD